MPNPVAVIYCRISDKKQVGNTSLAEQERACRQWCREQGYVDRVLTACL
jgi:DNA invertase Pin-like site-specific DNA recombinase